MASDLQLNLCKKIVTEANFLEIKNHLTNKFYNFRIALETLIMKDNDTSGLNYEYNAEYH